MTSAIERAVAAVGPEPYYEHEGITIYHGDCRELNGESPPRWAAFRETQDVGAGRVQKEFCPALKRGR